jgi:hypothetical protein
VRGEGALTLHVLLRTGREVSVEAP